MINITALVILCAISLLVNLFLVMYIGRLIRWLRYWRNQYIGAIRPIRPVPDEETFE